jgi:mannose-6-phosphate isomerase-like protein (cupin superfamily)
MELFDLKTFKGGWFVGNFSPTIIPSKDVEVCIKRYKAGDADLRHYHKEADEITVVVSGEVIMNNIVYKPDSVILIHKGEATDFYALTDAVTCVVKLPCVIGDKYFGDPH